jgi:hypothetical protein
MEPLSFKDTIGGVLLLISIVVVRALYFPIGSDRAQRFPRLAGFALIGTAFGLLAAAYWTFSNLSGNRLEDTFMIPIGLSLIVAAMIGGYLGARKIQSSNDAEQSTNCMDPHRALASLEETSESTPRTPMSVWILATLFALGVFALYGYPAISTGVVRGKKSTCRIPEDVECTVVHFGLGVVIAIVSTLIIFISARRLLRWLRG